MSKFKYLLLGGIISILSIGYSSAVSISCGEDSETSEGFCNPSQITINNTLVNASEFSSNDEFHIDLECEYDGIVVDCANGLCNVMGGEEYVELSEAPQTCSVFYDGNYGDISFNYTPSNSGGGDDNTGGESGGTGDFDSSLIGSLSPVVSGLSSAVSEIIPYIVYIGLGLLSAIIGFVVIKWLINWVRAKSFGVFSSRKKR